MKWSLRVARLAGIDIRVHVTFVLILLLGALQWGTPHGARGALFGVALLLLLFACVALHELGHALVARRFGLVAREIVLLPIGGVAMLAGRPRRPLHELLIAIAGPAVNVVLAGALLLAGAQLFGVDAIAGADLLAPSRETLFAWLLGANLMLALFNLLPVFPLDGGRVLRALLAMRLGQARASVIATIIGQIGAVLLGLFAIFSGHLVLAVIALFLFVGAGRERASEQARASLRTLRAGDACDPLAPALRPGHRLGEVVRLMLATQRPAVAVLYAGDLLGVVTRDDVIRAMMADPTDTWVTGVMRRDVLRVDAQDPLDEVADRMVDRGALVAAVFDGDAYVGLLSASALSEAALLQTFVQQRDAARRAGGRMVESSG